MTTDTSTDRGAGTTPDPAAPEVPSADRWARWRTGTFGPASELPYRRRTSDRIRLVVAADPLGGIVEGDLALTELRATVTAREAVFP